MKLFLERARLGRMERIIKNYRQWMGTKSFINNNGIRRSFKEGDIWWAAVGENVGVEIDGKSRKYSRPVLILKKHSSLFFTAVPLSTQIHTGTWYVQFDFRGKTQTAVVVQAKPMDVSRLYERIGEVSKGDYSKIMAGFQLLFTNKNMP